MAKVFAWSDIGAHNTRDDCWMVIDKKVYDITKFLDEHPGGEEVLLEQAGIDASEAFEEIGHSDDARDLLKKFYLGDLADTVSC
ncbi:cytochrome b5-like heme/steroid binding domain-containing protein [Chytridium lagenaria]|nr:cytochrome b5-like heme/steroid binding domain-containing protein [Chytridium lagenaria]